MNITKIYGPPGTGKTTELVNTIASETGTFKFLSYTKAAATEAVSRVAPGNTSSCSTLHALAFSALGLKRTQTVDSDKLQDYSEATGIPFKRRNEESQDGDDYLRVLSYANNKMIPPGDAYDIFGRPGKLAQWEMFLRTYGEWKGTYGYMDFDDMLMSGLSRRFQKMDYLIVDESQDLSPLQWKLLTQVVKTATPRDIYIAGDDDQAIYEWNGADPHGMAVWGLDGYTATSRVLPTSHRLPDTVHTWVHKNVIPLIGTRFDKQWVTAKRGGAPVTRYASAENLIDTISWSHTEDVRILARDNYRLRDISSYMSQLLIPHAMIGGFTPWTDIVARAIRGWYKPGNMTQEERVAIEKISDVPADQVSGKDWRQVFKLKPDKIDLYEAIGTGIMDEPRIILSTIHQAKGAEAAVTIVDLEMNARTALEYRNNPDAEARVMYVATTRAKERLILCAENPLI
jgi:DNA helicase-2/ATP-dependent DNA helicase PcrA